MSADTGSGVSTAALSSQALRRSVRVKVGLRLLDDEAADVLNDKLRRDGLTQLELAHDN